MAFSENNAQWYDGYDDILQKESDASTGIDAPTYIASTATTGSFGSPALNHIGDQAGEGYNVEDLEVKLSHRFRVRFGVFAPVGHHIKTISKPNVSFAEVEVAKLNSKVYFAGRKSQDPLSLEFDDALDGSVSRAVQTQLQRQANFDNNFHARSSGAYFFNIVEEELTGDGSFLMAWYFHKCMLVSADFGTLDYSDDAGTSAVSLSVRYSNFTTHMAEGNAAGDGANSTSFFDDKGTDSNHANYAVKDHNTSEGVK